MNKLSTSLLRTLLVALLLVCCYSDGSWTQFNTFGTIVASTAETIGVDLNKYFMGDNITFSTIQPGSIPPKFKSLVQGKLTEINPEVVRVLPPQDMYGSWPTSQLWTVLDTSFQISYYNVTANGTLELVNSFRFEKSVDNRACSDMAMVNNATLLVTCYSTVEPLEYLYFIDATLNTVASIQMQQNVAVNLPRYLIPFPLNLNVVIDYPLSDADCKVPAMVLVYNISDIHNVNKITQFGGRDFNTSDFCLKSVGVANGSVFMLDYKTHIYRADDILIKGGLRTTYNMTDNGLKMSVTLENYQGQAKITVLAISSTTIYQIDWSAPVHPILVNKYPLKYEPNSQNMVMLDKSRSFIYAVVITPANLCRFLAFSEGLSPAYFDIPCPFANTSQAFVNKIYDQVAFFQFTLPTTSYQFYQISKSILQIPATSPKTLTLPLLINNIPVTKIPFNIIDQYDNGMKFSNNSQPGLFAITPPASSSFIITNLFSGPFPNVSSNLNSYTIRNPVKKLLYTTTEVPRDENVSYVYYYKQSFYKWAFITANDTLIVSQCLAGSNPYNFDCKTLHSLQLNTSSDDTFDNYIFEEHDFPSDFTFEEDPGDYTT